MVSTIVVHPEFDGQWPYAADHLHDLWEERFDDVEFRRLDADDDRPLSEVVDDPAAITRLVALRVPVTESCIAALENLEAAAVYTDSAYRYDEVVAAELDARGVEVHHQQGSQGYWGQSVAECALGLTIAALRRIPQLHGRIQEDQSPWDYDPGEAPEPRSRGIQFGDDPRFVNGTVAGKDVRVVGVGNIGSRYASFADFLGADVAAYDPYADEPCFHRAGARRAWGLPELVEGADVFAPLVPPTEETYHMITAEHIEALPEGALVVLATRARIVEPEPLRERVLADELALAADVWDENPGEPLPPDDPLLGRHNVVHTPHIAGRTVHANEQWAERLDAQF